MIKCACCGERETEYVSPQGEAICRQCLVEMADGALPEARAQLESELAEYDSEVQS